MGTKKKARQRKRPYTDGLGYEFHGAYKSKAAAEKKARKVGGFYRGRLIKHGDYRYVVMVTRDGSVPF
jgi:hypothetical protein